jgi:hypothetical protein
MRFALSGDPRGDAALAKPLPVTVVVVAAIGELLSRPASRPTAQPRIDGTASTSGRS